MSENINKIDDNSLDLNEYLTSKGLSGGYTGAEVPQSLSLTAFLNLLIANVANNSDKCDVWSDILLDLIDNNVVNESMVCEVLTITITKSQSHSLANRVFSCKMLAKLCRKLNEHIFVKTVLQTVKCLCNDSQPSVRAHISKQLSLLSQNMSFETIAKRIIPLLIQLTNDRELIVRIAAIESLIELIPRLDQQFSKESVLPHIVIFFGSALETNDRSLGLIFMNFGKLCQSLPKDVITNEKWFLDYYFNVFLVSNDFQFKAKDIAFHERDIHCRNLLALFFPILLHIYGPNESLNSIMNFLCCDLDISVVRTIASVFPQINSHMKNAYKLYPQLSKLMNQKNIILVKELMPFFSNLLIDAIKSAPNENKELLFDDLAKNLINCENTISLNLDWRLHISFFRNLTEIAAHLPVNHLKMYFIPLIISRIVTSRPIPVRIESSRCLLCLFRDFPILLGDMNVYEWFVTTLCYGKSCSQRMLFLNVCELINQLCDNQIMIKFILKPMLSLCADKVPNIRLNVCKKFKAFKSLLEFPQISDKIETIKSVFREMLATERDNDVIESIHQMLDQLDWSSVFEEHTIEGLTQDMVRLEIGSNSEVNNNSIEAKELNSEDCESIKVKSCLPQLIRSQSNSPSISKCLPNNRFSDSFDSIPSRIPKAITKSSK